MKNLKVALSRGVHQNTRLLILIDGVDINFSSSFALAHH